MSIEDAFARILGRQASDEERQRLYRLRDALGLRDNDAFWSIVMALEYYDSFFRQYPAQLAQEAGRTIESARAALSAAAQSEAAHVQRVLSAKVAETSVDIARRLADRPIGVHRVTLLLAALVAFGALCVHAGYHLASTEGPLRSARASDLAGARQAGHRHPPAGPRAHASRGARAARGPTMIDSAEDLDLALAEHARERARDALAGVRYRPPAGRPKTPWWPSPGPASGYVVTRLDHLVKTLKATEGGI